MGSRCLMSQYLPGRATKTKKKRRRRKHRRRRRKTRRGFVAPELQPYLLRVLVQGINTCLGVLAGTSNQTASPLQACSSLHCSCHYLLVEMSGRINGCWHVFICLNRGALVHHHCDSLPLAIRCSFSNCAAQAQDRMYITLRTESVEKLSLR